MYLDYSKLEFDADGFPETPDLLLTTLGEDIIGTIPGVHNLRLNIKFSEPSEISFDIPAVIDGEPNWIYDIITGHMLIYTKHYGIYNILNPSTEADGISEIKHIEGYSIEKTLESKKFFLEEGTYKFYDQTNPRNPNTVMGRMLEIAHSWNAGYVSPSIAQKYRTFDQFDDYLLPFIYNTAPQKYRCVFVFEPYEKTINVYDADEERPCLPIYLDFDNLLDSVEIEELSNEMATAIRPYGADELDIREVNPLGTNWIYDIGYFIAKGDIPSSLAGKWTYWQQTVINNIPYYEALSALRASTTTKLLTAQAELTELKGELETLTGQQSVTIQALAMETTDSGKNSQQSLLSDINAKISAKKSEISQKEREVTNLQSDIDGTNPNSAAGKIAEVVNRLDIKKFFTEDEYRILSSFFIEQDITEDTFVATDIDMSVSGSNYSLSNATVKIVGSSISRVDLGKEFGKTMYVLAGGSFSLSGSHNLSCDVIRGTIEVSSNNDCVLSIYAGTICVNNVTSPSGLITIAGTISGLTSDICPITVDEVTTYEGSSIQFGTASGTMYLTANISDYQRYSVKKELYDYAVGVLADLSVPTYEFSVDSGNFIFEKEFKPFRDRLELGKGVYLNIGSKQLITPYIIEIELDFENRSDFSIVFSNRFKRHDNVNTLKDMLEKTYSSSRNFDASKYLYNQVSNQATQVSQFMNNSLKAAVNTIIGAANQSVIIDGAGIHVGGESPCQIRIVNSMIAISDDGWETAKLAIGLFSSDEVGTYFGVNAEVIGGKLIVGNNLIIENATDDGVMQFKVDSSGAWLNNSTFVLQKDYGGKIIIDPKYGIVAGTGNLYSTSGTTVYPSFVGSNGAITFDGEGFPNNANFYLDIQNGNAYFRGKVRATSGEIGGFTIEKDYLRSGSGGNFVALNGSGTNAYSQYAIWVGANNPSSAPFWVKKNGDVSIRNGYFIGKLYAPYLSGDLTPDPENPTDSWLRGCGISVGGNYRYGKGNFYVDPDGNVTMQGSINLSNGSITWGSSNSPVLALYARSYLSKPTSRYAYYPAHSTTSWHQTLNLYDLYASYSYDGGQTWTTGIKIRGEDGVNGIDGKDGSDATVNERNVFNVLTNGGTKFGIFGNSTSNSLYINANFIKAGTLDANLIELSCGYGGFCKGYGSTGTSTTYGAMMYGSNGKGNYPYIIVTNAGCCMNTGRLSFYITRNMIHATEAISIGSDRRLKKDIDYDLSKFKDFFCHLKPSSYQYKHGTSGRIHTGFIAQDVENALEKAGLSRQDFAGLTVEPVEEVIEDGISDYRYSLRYEEFVSLNTYMIQELNRKVKELESRINELSKGV